MMQISVSDAMKLKVPDLVLSCIKCDVEVHSDTEQLWEEIDSKTLELKSKYQLEQISSIPAIAASRVAYKACGKDPARYRLSAEALIRRVVQGKGLYCLNNIVDLLNLISISTGYSIGGYDADKIKGDVEFGIGKKDEPYNGIGRGNLNIENLPVFRDGVGAFGTPTSDSERTAVTVNTLTFLMVIINFGKADKLDDTTQQAVRLLKQYGGGKNFNVWQVN
ncbi:MAG TPA: phenylalanine--tRNA ligase beta subunit-related protein [Mariniphaga sp.]|nr:phenylalanine--tRNA ligase beta subunit-related protein [Mariniphaga sp.]